MGGVEKVEMESTHGVRWRAHIPLLQQHLTPAGGQQLNSGGCYLIKYLSNLQAEAMW